VYGVEEVLVKYPFFFFMLGEKETKPNRGRKKGTVQKPKGGLLGVAKVVS